MKLVNLGIKDIIKDFASSDSVDIWFPHKFMQWYGVQNPMNVLYSLVSDG